MKLCLLSPNSNSVPTCQKNFTGAKENSSVQQSVLKVWVQETIFFWHLKEKLLHCRWDPNLDIGKQMFGILVFCHFPNQAPGCLDPQLSLRMKAGSKKEGRDCIFKRSCHFCISLLLYKTSFIKGEFIALTISQNKNSIWMVYKKS